MLNQLNLPLTHIWQPAQSPQKQLVIVLHGRGDSAEGFLWLQEMLSIDSLDFLLLNAPDPYAVGFSWYDLPPNQLPGITRSQRLLGDVLQVTEQNGYAPERTFLFGFSQGCLLTLEFGARHTSRLAGYIGISGYVYDLEAILREFNPEANQGDWLITHGTDDEMLPVAKTRQQIQQLQAGGFGIDYREFTKTHTIDVERELPEIQQWMQSRCGEPIDISRIGRR